MKAARWLAAMPLLLLAACGGHKTTRPPPPSVRNEPPASAPAARNAPETSLPQDRRYSQSRDGEPDRKVDVATLPEPRPADEPRSKYGNRSPYSVLGESYSVLPSSAGYVERGIASWYGNKFHGYMTSSFETYDMYQFTAAHKTLPLPSWVRVTNLANNKSVVVRVNDRGPFHQNRIIDLSYAAAARIGIWPAGTGMVEVRAVGPHDAEAPPPTTTIAKRTPAPPAATLPPRAPPPTPSTGTRTPRVYVQVGSYSDAGNAQRLADTLTRAGLGDVQVVDANVNGRRILRVRLGPLKDAEEADRLTEKVQRLGLGKPTVAVD